MQWTVPLKDKKGITITKAFQKFINESGCKPNKIWVDKSNEFYNRLMKSSFQDIEKGNLSLLKDSLEPSKIKF